MRDPFDTKKMSKNDILVLEKKNLPFHVGEVPNDTELKSENEKLVAFANKC